ncbi:hypothetical protein ACVNPX_07370 [Staphylococcus aureus]
MVESARKWTKLYRNSYQLIEERAQIATNIENQQTYIDQIDAILNRFETVMIDKY